MFSKVLSYVVEEFPEHTLEIKVADTVFEYQMRLQDAFTKLEGHPLETEMLQLFAQRIEKMLDTKGVQQKSALEVLQKAITICIAIECTNDWQYK